MPWQFIKTKNSDDYKEIMEEKASISPTNLCKDLPVEFARILEYIFSLDANIEPDYSYIEVLLKKAADHNGIVIDNVFDWYD